jgi:co-chaperonin GroES (HSP10)
VITLFSPVDDNILIKKASEHSKLTNFYGIVMPENKMIYIKGFFSLKK